MGGSLVLLVRLAISMAVVMLVMGVAARLVRRRQGLGGARAAADSGRRAGPGRATWSARGARRARPVPPVEVLFRRSLAKGANLTLVKAGDKQYLLGVTEQSVNLLTEIEMTPEPSGPATAGLDQPGPPGSGTDLSGLDGLEDIDQWRKTGRTPVSLDRAATPGQPETAWKLAIHSLRERTVRR